MIYIILKFIYFIMMHLHLVWEDLHNVELHFLPTLIKLKIKFEVK